LPNVKCCDCKRTLFPVLAVASLVKVDFEELVLWARKFNKKEGE
jgi:hypothetical protein